MRLSNLFLLFLFTLLSITCKKEVSRPAQPSPRPCPGCSAVNLRPIARAGNDTIIYIPSDSAILNGTASMDPDGAIIEWQWTKFSGPASFTIQNASASRTVVKNLQLGIYQMILQVKDDGGLFSTDTMQITVRDRQSSGHAPVANAGPDQNLNPPFNSGMLDGSASYDLDNDIVSYRWKYISGPGSFGISDSTAVRPAIYNLVTGIYTFELKVTDLTGLFDTDRVMIIVNPPAVGCYNSSCGGYWVCLDNTGLNNVSYTGTPPAYFPGAFGAATSNGTKMYFAGGHDEGSYGGVMDILLIFDVIANTWTNTSLSQPRSHLSAGSCGTKVLFAGGNNSGVDLGNLPSPPPTEYYNRVDILDINTGLINISNLSEARSDMASVSTATKIFFIGGKKLLGYSSIMDIYDYTSNTWNVVDLPRERGFASAVIAGNKIIIAGGRNDTGNLTMADVYDISTQQWSTLNVPHEHPVAAMAIANNKVIIAGGDDAQNKWADIYDLSNSSWNSSMLSDSRKNMAVATANNKVIFMGGSFSCSVDIYNSQTETWSATKLNDGVNGVVGATAANKCGFIGFLYSGGYSMTNTVMVIDP